MNIIIVGGGHASLPLLTSGIFSDDISVILLSPDRYLYYSGMMPQFLGGYYSLNQVRIDLSKICMQHHINFINEATIEMNADSKIVTSKSGATFTYDVLVINAGVVSKSINLFPDDKPSFNVKPLSQLVEFRSMLNSNPGCSIAVLGGGAAGVEIAMNLASSGNYRITIFEKERDILLQFDESVRQTASDFLREKGVNIIRSFSDDLPQNFDCYLNAAGNISTASTINHNLAVDSNQRILTNEFLQVDRYPEVFAAGDIANIGGQNYSQIGVHAVKQGKTLNNNIHRFIKGKSLSTFSPYLVNPLILSMNAEKAILTWPGFSYTGKLASMLKHYIDEKWIKDYL